MRLSLDESLRRLWDRELDVEQRRELLLRAAREPALARRLAAERQLRACLSALRLVQRGEPSAQLLERCVLRACDGAAIRRLAAVWPRPRASFGSRVRSAVVAAAGNFAASLMRRA